MGSFFAELGLPQNAGRLFGYLLTCEPAEQSAKGLGRGVGASTGSVNTMLRMLVGMGMVTRRAQVGSRQYLYQIRPGAWMDLIAARLHMVARLNELAQLGLDCLGETSERTKRLEAMRDFYAFLDSEMVGAINRYVRERECEASQGDSEAQS